MPLEPAIQTILTRSGTLAFPSNLSALPEILADPASSTHQPTGHIVFYGSHGRRILATDPDGHPLHECEWGTIDGALRLLRARVHLDWGAWVGLIPNGLVNAMTLDLSRKPGWERLRADDLRGMAAQAMQVPLEEIRFFYDDRDVTIDAKGTAMIRHRKDVLSLLPDGMFERKQFMACMGAMHWEDIDFLPVVELFLSLLPGTGSAVFELIRGLYDDQNREKISPRRLRYRGIPTYPSEAAYRLFSGFFCAQVPGGGDPFPVFMDPPRSHLVTWLPVPDPPRRYFDAAQKLCVTIQEQRILKATCWDDRAGLSYQPFDRRGMAPCRRGMMVDQNNLLLMDREACRAIPLSPRWGTVTEPRSVGTAPAGVDWVSVFGEAAPSVSPEEAFGAVLLYPDDEREIDELPTQPFVADHLQDLIEQDRSLAAQIGRADHVLISGFDATLTTCIGGDRPRAYTVLYDHPAFAQRQAQMLWNTWSRAGRLDWLTRVRMRSRREKGHHERHQTHDFVYEWTPFSYYGKREMIRELVEMLARILSPGAVAFVVGPPEIAEHCKAARMNIQAITPLSSLPTFRMHQSVLPRARLKPEVMLYQLDRS
ncbi:MAG: hypothetical protein K0S45_2684 [Nitrospira sp.]|jgi:hypothetical protein|nr:hypothetical protein [Nitrospira sp.]